MPLLDRTAARLEPAGLRRLLSRGTPSGRRPSASTSPRRVTGPTGFFDTFAPDSSEPLHASALLLDFLYPTGALISLAGRPSRRWPLAGTKRKALSSSAAPPPPPPVSSAHGEPCSAACQALDALLKPGARPSPSDYDAFDQAWRLYSQLDGLRQAQKDVSRRLVHFLSPSRRDVDTGRVLDLFARLDPACWDASAVTAAVASLLQRGERQAAWSIFVRSAETPAWTAHAPGMDLLLADALQTQAWDDVTAVWSVYREHGGHAKAPASQLAAVVALPAMDSLLEAWAQVLAAEADHDAADTPPSPFRECFKAVLEAVLGQLDAAVAFPLVALLANPRIYERFVGIALDQRQPRIAARAYAAWRRLPRFRPRTVTLQRLARVFAPAGDERSMAALLVDWRTNKGRPNFWAYQKFLGFYAARGDVATVDRLWHDFARTYPRALVSAEDAFAHLLKVRAVRGDVAAVEAVFAEIESRHGVAPNTVCWNIRLHACVARGDAPRALRMFEQLCDHVTPDAISFGTILRLVGGRGDLDLAIDLYWLAQQCGVVPSVAMQDALVEAFCQNDRLADAERLCVVSTRRRLDEEGRAAEDGRSGDSAKGSANSASSADSANKEARNSSIALWNTLLRHHAYRHDLVAVHRLLRVMTRLQVSYDNGTYSALLLALAQCRQPRRAAELLRVAQEDGAFTPTAQHFVLLMMAYVRSNQPHRALQVNRLMHHLGFPRSSRQILMVIKAFSQWQSFPRTETSTASDGDGSTGQRDDTGSTTTAAAARRELFAKALREFQRSLATVPSNSGRDAVRMHLGAVRRFSLVLFMLVQARDFAGIGEVMQLYRAIAPANERQEPLPLKLCNVLMLADFYEGRFDRARTLWREIVQRTRDIARPQPLAATRIPEILGHAKPAGFETPLEADIDGMRGDAPSSHSPDTPGSPDSSRPRPGPPLVVGKLRYSLSDPLKTILRLYAAEGDADGLMRVVNDDVLGNGFLLDSKNWNHYAQHLARLGRTADAFAVCEEQLMRQWSGASVLRARFRGLPGDNDETTTLASDENRDSDRDRPTAVDPTGTARLRLSRLRQIREGATRFNAPMTYTLMVLAKALLALEQAAMWSPAAERQWRALPAACPKTLQSVRTMVQMNSWIEGRVFGSGDGSAPANDFDLLSFISDGEKE